MRSVGAYGGHREGRGLSPPCPEDMSMGSGSSVKMVLLTVGMPRQRWVESVGQEYLQRISRWVPLAWEHVAEARHRPQDIKGIEEEGLRLLRCLQPRDTMVLLDEGGRSFSSPQFSQWLFGTYESTPGRLVLIVGGAFGVSSAVRERAHEAIALSAMTFPHELCAVVLLEQLYRAVTIRHHVPYHHA